MAAPPHPTTQYFSSNFVIGAGSVLFRQSPETNRLEICLLYHRPDGEWHLPKGRKDCGESIEVAAVRETFEETGFSCQLLPCRMPTRALEPGINSPDMVRTLSNLTEPFAVTTKDRGARGIKTIWWFLTRLKSKSTVKIAATQTDYEQYDSQFVDAEEACTRLTYQMDRDVVVQALKLVRDSLEMDDHLFE
jgi:8-oxo-dGTP pyrophosphatase MutT (NUDIX family)